MEKHYQYIIIGAGCAGLQLAKSLLQLNNILVQSILLIEASETHEEKSWCFWYEKNHPYRHLVRKEWDAVEFVSDNFTTIQNISPKSYQFINSLDFYNDCIASFTTDNRIEVLFASVSEIQQLKQPVIITNNDTYTCDTVFFTNPKLVYNNYPKANIWQHFVGWIIETDGATFNDTVATMMDFSIDNTKLISFVYVLPFSATKALIECTIFSECIQETSYYEQILGKYIAEKFTKNYRITGKEFGKIPMQLPPINTTLPNNIVPIGTAAGCIKASTGYSFVRVMLHTNEIITAIINKQLVPKRQVQQRFTFYDALFLNIISSEPYKMKHIFYRLFKHNTLATVLLFLDEKTTLLQDVMIFLWLPKKPFLKALVKKISNTKRHD
jgi:lycopene beta-cyclase